MVTRPNGKRGNCKDRNARGAPCGMPVLGGSDYCFAHDPERAPERAEARKRGGENRRTRAGAPASAEPIALRNVASIQAQLEQAVGDTLLQENTANRARAVGYLLGLALKALEVGELEERIAALEQRMTGDVRRFG